MDTETHPVTGVELNRIAIERKALSFDEAVTVHLMRWKGTKFQSIAHLLGTNTARVGEVLKGTIHPAAQREALKLRSI